MTCMPGRVGEKANLVCANECAQLDDKSDCQGHFSGGEGHRLCARRLDCLRRGETNASPKKRNKRHIKNSKSQKRPMLNSTHHKESFPMKATQAYEAEPRAKKRSGVKGFGRPRSLFPTAIWNKTLSRRTFFVGTPGAERGCSRQRRRTVLVRQLGARSPPEANLEDPAGRGIWGTSASF